MTPSPQEDAAERLREEAAIWFARMRGPDADRRNDAFQAWLRSDDRHLKAYNEAAEIFSLGGLLPAALPEPMRRLHMPGRVQRLLVSAAVLALVATASLMPLARRAQPEPGGLSGGGLKVARAMLRADDRQHSIGLADGSTVTLDAGSRVSVFFTPYRRTLRLLRGRARFDVAHGNRPFTVQTSAGTTTAVGTVFDVGLQPGNVTSIHLLRGAIDVDQRGQHRRLTSGEAVQVAQTERIPAPRQFPAGATQWVKARLDCDGVPLAAILTEANRRSSVQIVAGQSNITGLRVSGTFQIDDPEQLAKHLAVILDLRVEQRPWRTLTLRR